MQAKVFEEMMKELSKLVEDVILDCKRTYALYSVDMAVKLVPILEPSLNEEETKQEIINVVKNNTDILFQIKKGRWYCLESIIRENLKHVDSFASVIQIVIDENCEAKPVYMEWIARFTGAVWARLRFIELFMQKVDHLPGRKNRHKRNKLNRSRKFLWMEIKGLLDEFGDLGDLDKVPIMVEKDDKKEILEVHGSELKKAMEDLNIKSIRRCSFCTKKVTNWGSCQCGIYYCGKRCQRKDWKQHKKVCRIHRWEKVD